MAADRPIGLGVDLRGAELARVVEQRRHDGDGDGGEHEPAADLGEAAAPEVDQPDHDQRPEEVELLFDGEAPQVAQRGEVEQCGVPGAGPDLVPVGDVGGAGDHVATQLAERVALEDRRVDHQQRHHQEQRRQQPSGPAHPELLEVDATLLFVLADQQQGDQVAADHEEHLDADEPARHPAVVGVIEHHGHDGESAHAVEAGEIRHAEIAWRGGSHSSGRALNSCVATVIGPACPTSSSPPSVADPRSPVGPSRATARSGRR